MALNSISGSLPALQLQIVKNTGVSDKPVKDTTTPNNQPVKQEIQAGAAEAAAGKEVTASTLKQNKTAASETVSTQTSGVVNHVVVSYNQHGKLRTKFEDSRNNVVYQVPSEMVARMEDQMLTSNTSTDIKG